MSNETYTVQGMTCEHCASAVSAEVRKIGGVDDVAIDVAAGRVTITSADPLAPQDVREAVEEAGYELVVA